LRRRLARLRACGGGGGGGDGAPADPAAAASEALQTAQRLVTAGVCSPEPYEAAMRLLEDAAPVCDGVGGAPEAAAAVGKRLAHAFPWRPRAVMATGLALVGSPDAAVAKRGDK
jgi:hypothetical protein